LKPTALIIDDENLARENLAMLISEFCPEIEVIGSAGNITEAKKKIEELHPKIIFLDIRMPSGSEGFDLLDSIPEKNFHVIFVTAFKDYAIKAFNANAIHYVLKPVDIEDLRSAVQKAVETIQLAEKNPEVYTDYLATLKNLSQSLTSNKQTNKITINHSKGIKIIEDDTILYIEADSNCSILHFSDSTKYLDTRTLGLYEEMLNPDKFFRIHKSYLINLNQLSEYINEDGYFAILKSGQRLPVARTRVQDFLVKIKSI
jgi:two-component system LytT family response regulator